MDVWSDDGAGDGANAGPDELNQTAPLPQQPITPPAKKQKAKKSRRHVAAEKEKEKTKSTGKGKGQEAKALPPPGDDKWLGATVEKEFSDGRYRGTVHGITAASASEDNPLYYLIHYDEDDDAEEFDHDELLFHLMPQNQVVCLFHTEPSLPPSNPNLRRSPLTHSSAFFNYRLPGCRSRVGSRPRRRGRRRG